MYLFDLQYLQAAIFFFAFVYTYQSKIDGGVEILTCTNYIIISP